MKTIARDNTSIAYEVYGSGNTTLFFVHGSYLDQTYWRAQVDYFKNSYKIVTIDLPGHGLSGRDRSDWTIKGFADDVVAVMKEEKLSDVILIGHSMGGNINLLVAEAYPTAVIGFIAIDVFKNAGQPLPPEFQKKSEALLQKMQTDFGNTNEQYAKMALLSKASPENLASEVIILYRNGYAPMGGPITSEVFNLYRSEAKLLPLLGVKLYLISVDYMPMNEQALKDLMGSNFEVTYLHGTSHFPMIEEPAQLNAVLEKLVETISSSKKTLHHTMRQIP